MTILFGGLVFYVNSTLQAELKSRQEFQLKRLLKEKAEIVYNLLLEDDDNDSDNLLDEAWKYVEQNEDVSLKDLSSYINPNWVDKELLTHLNGAVLPSPETLFIMDGKTIADVLNNENDGFINYREKHGVLPDIKNAYKKYFSAEIMDKYFTEYNYFNINIAAISTQRKLYEARSGSEGEAENFYNQLIIYFDGLNAQFNKPGAPAAPMVDTNTLESWFLTRGPGQAGFDLMFPVYNAEPVMNIHHVPEELLYAILSFPPFKIADPQGKTKKAIEMRKAEAINKGTLAADILGHESQSSYPGKKIYQIFGIITWFWEIKATDGNAELTWIIARIPPRQAGSVTVEYKLIKEQFIIRKPVKKESDDTNPEATGDDDIPPGDFDNNNPGNMDNSDNLDNSIDDENGQG